MLKWHPRPCRDRARLATTTSPHSLHLHRPMSSPGSPGATHSGGSSPRPPPGFTSERGVVEWGALSQSPDKCHGPPTSSSKHHPHLLFQKPLPLSFLPRCTWTHLKHQLNELPPRHDLTIATGNPGLLEGLFTTPIIRGCAKPSRLGKVSTFPQLMAQLVFTNYM